MWRDVVYGCRYLNQHRGFAAAAVLTLGLGIGISTAVFSVVNTVLMQPLPYKEADRLVRVVERARRRRLAPRYSAASACNGPKWPSGARTAPRCSELAFTLTPPITLMSSSEGAVRLSGALVSPNLFTMLGADARDRARARRPRRGVRGRVLSSSALRRGDATSGARPDVVGHTVALKTLGPESGFLDGTPLTIVGVMPPRFDYPVPFADFWAPIAADSPVRRVGWVRAGDWPAGREGCR